MSPIPQEWIVEYVEKFLAFASKFGPDTPMGRASMLRADHVMDMVKAFQEQYSLKSFKDVHFPK